MMRRVMMEFLTVSILVAATATATAVFGGNVTYDHRALVIDGKRRVLVSGSIHYPRSTPDMWPGLIQKSKEGGLDVIETYVFWNLHEPTKNQYDFEGRKDLVKFVKTVADAGLYVHLRIGPYRFTAKIVDMMKEENLYASQGGPIILSQIENEYGNIDSAYGPAAKTYIKWAASMATSLDTGVPWVMCQQRDAPDPIIDTCNGFYCDGYTPNAKNKPTMWTENWTGWFLSFGGAVPYRPAEDIAFAVARFYQRGGTFQNYYMDVKYLWILCVPPCSTMVGLISATLLEDPLLRQVMITMLHLMSTERLDNLSGASVYKTSSGCAAFLANVDTKSDATVNFKGNSYHLPAWSVSILPDCKNVVFNTAKINSVSTIRRFVATSVRNDLSASEALSSDWSYVSEPVGISSDNAFNKQGLVEQINTTADQSDYLWYSLSTDIKGDEPFLQDGSQTVLHVESLGHVLHLFVNGQIQGSAIGNGISKDIPITLKTGKNKLDLLSVTVGLKNYGAFFDKAGAGITGPVQLKGLKNGSTVDLSSQRWTYQVGLKGEALGLHTGDSSLWVSGSSVPKSQPLIWYKTSFDSPAGDNPITIDFTGMGKGEAWVNGESIGRYWPSYSAPNGGCAGSCSYKGPYGSTKCLKNCGKPSQTLYHVPRSWLKPSGNVLVLFEEMGGNPTQISFATQELESLCSRVSESHPLPLEAWTQDKKSGRKSKSKSKPRVSFECPHPNQVIDSIKFASFGTPQGKCGSFSHGECRSTDALSILQKACIGSRTCNIEVSTGMFGDPCTGVVKSLAVEASCA
ncbi:D-galactoside/L-rhamnose binding SUEL lectin domain-containing protein [Cynara cardunculus var. scolymus]|uniref:Beta-galactosidase n=1 Tax=Cynara cardunculus var. scolymus TaxID=59895 RepID=A0A103XHD6_CYNCS|nr:D-galactoside/L-rhamnose binding SUEL lectin domain-containing protein [Cynara cardunculus var. scolymus]